MTCTTRLRFLNEDATPKEVVLDVSKSAVAPIMEWYGAYFAGDTYRVFVDDTEVAKDQNGQLVGDLP